MKRCLTASTLILMLVALLALPTVSHADGQSITIEGLTSVGCNPDETNFNWTSSGFTPGPFYGDGYSLNLFVHAGGQVYMNENDSGGSTDMDDNYSLYPSYSYGPTTAGFPLPANTTITISMIVRDSGNDIVAESDLDFVCGGSASGAVTWFNPGDGRVDGQPGDRLAVWCNTTATPPNIVVYGVGDNATNGSHGFWLATFNNADLLKAGKAGITKNAGAGNGTISAMQDGHGNFYVAWNGGIFNATGHGDFAKSFSCQF